MKSRKVRLIRGGHSFVTIQSAHANACVGILAMINGADYNARAIEIRQMLKDGVADLPDGQNAEETERAKVMIRRLQAADTWESYKEAVALWRLYNIVAPEDITTEHKPDRKSLIGYVLRGRLE